MTRKVRILVVLVGIGGLVSLALGRGPAKNLVAVIKKAAAEGTVAYKLTEPSEMIALLGEPQSQKERADGGMVVLEMTYPGLSVVFGKFRGEDAPFTLDNSGDV